MIINNKKNNNNLDKIEMLISNMTLAFSNFSIKILKKGFFGPNIRIFIFAENFAF